MTRNKHSAVREKSGLGNGGAVERGIVWWNFFVFSLGVLGWKIVPKNKKESKIHGAAQPPSWEFYRLR